MVKQKVADENHKLSPLTLYGRTKEMEKNTF